MVLLIPEAVTSCWATIAGCPASRLTAGLINETFLVRARDGGAAVLQRLHPVFDAGVNLDIAAVTEHLAAKGMITPRLIPTDDGRLWVETDDSVWRALTYVSGETYAKVYSAQLAHEAGLLVGRFHLALADFEHTYQSSRDNVHNMPFHLRKLEKALADHALHPLHEQVVPLAEPLLSAAQEIRQFGELPLRHAHGDLKISNLIFDAAGRAVCLIDLDTLCRMSWPLEMGDALRSWCNPREEDDTQAALDKELFEAAILGYRAGARGFIRSDEWEALVPGLIQICLELSARFLADALLENYFGWDASRYATRGSHNLARGRAMWQLYKSVWSQRARLERFVRHQSTRRMLAGQARVAGDETEAR